MVYLLIAWWFSWQTVNSPDGNINPHVTDDNYDFPTIFSQVSHLLGVDTHVHRIANQLGWVRTLGELMIWGLYRGEKFQSPMIFGRFLMAYLWDIYVF